MPGAPKRFPISDGEIPMNADRDIIMTKQKTADRKMKDRKMKDRKMKDRKMKDRKC
jgi:hypothetical protein